MGIEIKEITAKNDLRKFAKFNIDLYKDCPYHVPGLISEEVMTLSKDKNPAFENSEAVYFMAYKDGKIVGRIAGIIAHAANQTWNERHARFGFVDFIDDDKVVDALFNAVVSWAKSKDMTALKGPMGFTDMDHEGMLVEGFDQLGTMATIYNYDYYPRQMERMGYRKDQDWIEFKIFVPKEVPENLLRIGEIVKQKYGLKTIRFRNTKEIMPYAHRVFETLNQAYKPLYGFAELTPKQINYYINMYIPMLNPKLISVIVREKDDAVVGFGISLPSLSNAMRKAKGHLFPFGFIHLLKALHSKAKVIDLYLTGVLPEYQNKGVNSLLFCDLIPEYAKIGCEYAESNIELENNTAVQSQWKFYKTEQHKRRRIFYKDI